MVLAILLLISSFWTLLGVLLVTATVRSGATRTATVLSDSFVLVVMVLAAIALL